MVLFRNYFTKVSSQHADSECNSTNPIQCGRVDVKTIINEKQGPLMKVSTVFAELNITFGSCFNVRYRVIEHAGSLESTKEA